MNRRCLLALAAALFAAPLSYAHIDGMPYGLPKFYCEDSPFAGDQLTHDYGPPASGFLYIVGPIDGSVPVAASPIGLPNGCIEDPGWDRHYEYGVGGAWLLACWDDCWDGTGDGASGCFGTVNDHAEFPTVWVFDHVLSTLGSDVTFSVFADTRDNIRPLPLPDGGSCGDFESDFGGDCVNDCTVSFPAGLDGSYQVYVTGTQGHIWTNS